MHAGADNIVFFRDGALLACAFDAARLKVDGPAVRIGESVALTVQTGMPSFALSASGVLVYTPADSARSRVVSVSREGVEHTVADTPRLYRTPRVAPGGDRILVHSNGDVWVHDTTRNTFTRLTADATGGK